MTNENMIKQLKRLIPSLKYADDVNAVKGAIKELSQESKTDEENVHREREQAYMQGYEDASKKYRQAPCTDTVSRQAVLDINAHHHGQMPNHVNHEIWKEIKALPPVTQKPETVTEFADRCRECGARYGKLLEQKRGKWVRQTDDYHDYYECEYCGIAVGIDDIKNYCPNCGARMEREE